MGARTRRHGGSQVLRYGRSAARRIIGTAVARRHRYKSLAAHVAGIAAAGIHARPTRLLFSIEPSAGRDEPRRHRLDRTTCGSLGQYVRASEDPRIDPTFE